MNDSTKNAIAILTVGAVAAIILWAVLDEDVATAPISSSQVGVQLPSVQ